MALADLTEVKAHGHEGPGHGNFRMASFLRLGHRARFDLHLFRGGGHRSKNLLEAPGTTTRNKKLLEAPGFTAGNKKLLVTRIDVQKGQ